jgi:hypothetical protein
LKWGANSWHLLFSHIHMDSMSTNDDNAGVGVKTRQLDRFLADLSRHELHAMQYSSHHEKSKK